jgi:hypothetical protein
LFRTLLETAGALVFKRTGRSVVFNTRARIEFRAVFGSCLNNKRKAFKTRVFKEEEALFSKQGLFFLWCFQKKRRAGSCLNNKRKEERSKQECFKESKTLWLVFLT